MTVLKKRRRPRARYVVVHTVGGADNDVESFTDDGTGGFSHAYPDALDLAKEIREYPGHWARIDKVYLDAAQGQQAGSSRLIV